MKISGALFVFAVTLAAPLTTGPALAQSDPLPSTAYKLHEMNFDMWCQETMHYSADRCDKRLPEDVQKFDAYRKIVERYEIPYLREKEQRLRFDRDVLHADPVDPKAGDVHYFTDETRVIRMQSKWQANASSPPLKSR